ncbi:putative glycolipid-binding domain-containing protein [Arenibaculum pallidiluteum]|uniref:putative glycolipid-binding domain-containing protein n=1 Tax=Arenibaculum pallidiluteum TaxID=2812559 RepID=UPI001A96CC46|nr:putative glycolipid-binding domain-containing protein [Arenibaculum pallidiluteum]
MASYRWRTASGRGLEDMTLAEAVDQGGIRMIARSVVIAEGGFACRYDVGIDSLWRTRRLRVEMVGSGRVLALASDGEGRWTVDGVPAPTLGRAVDVDLSVSAFTNTLPIRRLGLAAGQSAEIVTAYVEFPGLDVFPDPQRYTRLSDRTYLYEAGDSDFRGVITVDEDGFMLDFEGMFSRVSADPGQEPPMIP